MSGNAKLLKNLVSDVRIAFLMGTHPRLGKKSPVKLIGKDVARMIACLLDKSFFWIFDKQSNFVMENPSNYEYITGNSRMQNYMSFYDQTGPSTPLHCITRHDRNLYNITFQISAKFSMYPDTTKMTVLCSEDSVKLIESIEEQLAKLPFVGSSKLFGSLREIKSTPMKEKLLTLNFNENNWVFTRDGSQVKNSKSLYYCGCPLTLIVQFRALLIIPQRPGVYIAKTLLQTRIDRLKAARLEDL